MKRVVVLITILCLFLVAQGKSNKIKVKFPLKPVPADSIEVGDFFWYGQLQSILRLNPAITPQACTISRQTVKHAEQLSMAWQKKVNDLDLTGFVKSETEKGKLRSAVDMVNESAQLLLATGDSRYADVMERSLYNGVCGWQYSKKSEEANLAAQTIANVKSYALATSDEHLYINMCIRGDVHIKNKKLDVKMMTITSTPWFDEFSLQFQFSPQKQHMVLHLKVPNWLTDDVLPNYKYSHYARKFSVIVSKHVIQPNIQNGYIVIDRVWSDSDYVLMKVPTPIRRVYSSAAPSQIALQKGVLVYGFKQFPEGMSLLGRDPIHSEFDIKRDRNVLSSGYYDSKGQKAGTYEAEPFLYLREDENAKIFVSGTP